jgi:predicted nucleic acid-binding protein
MNYLLDTNICVYAIKRMASVLERLQAPSPDEFGISAVTVAELWFGAAKSTRPKPTPRGWTRFCLHSRYFPSGLTPLLTTRTSEESWRSEAVPSANAIS